MAGEAVTVNKAQIHREMEQLLGKVPEWMKQLPDQALGGFWMQFRDFYMSETRIPQKYKELIGLGVAGATRCRYCTLFHTEAARLFGATDDEIAEANAMAAFTTMASTFVNGQQIDYDRFKRETQEIVQHVRQKVQQQPPRAPHARV